MVLTVVTNYHVSSINRKIWHRLWNHKEYLFHQIYINTKLVDDLSGLSLPYYIVHITYMGHGNAHTSFTNWKHGGIINELIILLSY